MKIGAVPKLIDGQPCQSLYKIVHFFYRNNNSRTNNSNRMMRSMAWSLNLTMSSIHPSPEDTFSPPPPPPPPQNSFQVNNDSSYLKKDVNKGLN